VRISIGGQVACEVLEDLAELAVAAPIDPDRTRHAAAIALPARRIAAVAADGDALARRFVS
jgi:hypothetical protein